MRMHINHVSKLEFLYAFRTAFFASITKSNIQGGLAGTGLVPYDPERVLSKLDIKLSTPTPPTSRPGTPQPWVFQTPHNPREAASQSTLIKNRIANHQNSSPTSMLAAVDQLTKGTMAIMHEVALLRSEVSSLRGLFAPQGQRGTQQAPESQKNMHAVWRIACGTRCKGSTRLEGRGWGDGARKGAG